MDFDAWEILLEIYKNSLEIYIKTYSLLVKKLNDFWVILDWHEESKYSEIL